MFSYDIGACVCGGGDDGMVFGAMWEEAWELEEVGSRLLYFSLSATIDLLQADDLPKSHDDIDDC